MSSHRRSGSPHGKQIWRHPLVRCVLHAAAAATRRLLDRLSSAPSGPPRPADTLQTRADFAPFRAWRMPFEHRRPWRLRREDLPTYVMPPEAREVQERGDGVELCRVHEGARLGASPFRQPFMKQTLTSVPAAGCCFARTTPRRCKL